jgi:hypothetical protein
MTAKRKPGSRTATVSYRALTITIREGNTGTLEFRLKHPDQTITPKSKTFEAACREALKHVLEHGGEMKGEYERE